MEFNTGIMAIKFIASDQQLCDEIAKRLEIEGGGENAGDFVRHVFQSWVVEKMTAAHSRELEKLNKDMGS